MPFTEDFTEYLDDADFATAVTFSRTAATVNVIFDAEYQDPMGIEASGPRAWGAASDFPGIIHGDTLTVSAVVYSVINTEPDGTGAITIKLRKTT